MTAQDMYARLSTLVDVLIRALVDHEADVRIELIAEQMHTNVRIRVAPVDFGKVVGREGKNAEAIRVLLAAAANKLGLPMCSVFIEDPEPWQRGKRSGHAPRKKHSYNEPG